MLVGKLERMRGLTCELERKLIRLHVEILSFIMINGECLLPECVTSWNNVTQRDVLACRERIADVCADVCAGSCAPDLVSEEN